MLTLLLLRHAKAEPGSATVADQDRGLAPRGRKDAPWLGRHIKSAGLAPDLVLCSTARRTRETWALAQPEIGEGIPVQFEMGIYEASEARLLAIIRRTPSTVKRLLMIGHNPGFEDLARDLIHEGDGKAIKRLSEKFPTSGLAVLECPADQWAKITPRSGHLAEFTAPRYLD